MASAPSGKEAAHQPTGCAPADGAKGPCSVSFGATSCAGA